MILDMAGDDTCFAFLHKLKNKGKALAGFEESLTILQTEATSKGLENENIALILDIIKKRDLGAVKCVSLIKCMIPKEQISNTLLKDLISWCIATLQSISVTVSSILLQWIVGLWEYGLGDKKTISMFYEVFFYHLLKNNKLEILLARIIYELTKPEDVTRRQVIRLLNHQKNYKKPQKHLNALLSLFKSYKPELVPEKIPSVSIGSTWRPIPDTLRLGFEDAKNRAAANNIYQKNEEVFKWTTFQTSQKNKFTEPVLPSVGYFHMGSSIFKEKDAKSIFDLSKIEDLGKYHTSVELPCNATSLLTNVAGYHLLMFADFEYQNRFSYNLYNTLRRAFLLEPKRYPKEEVDNLLDLTYEFLRYIQHGIPVVTRFLDEYLTCRTGEYQTKLLALLQWTPLSISVTELQEFILKHMQEMFFESSLKEKCEIIITLRLLLQNLCINNEIKSYSEYTESPFLGQKCTINLKETIPAVTNFAQYLIVSGLNIHSYSSLLMAEALSFYEQMFILEKHYNIALWTIAPSAVIYGSIISRSCLILSRLCSLIVEYREGSKRLLKVNLQQQFSQEFSALDVYADELISVLWYNQTFSGRHKSRGNFLKRLRDNAVEGFSIDILDSTLCINHHYAVLPYKFILNMMNLEISSKEDMYNVALQYFPSVSDFLRIIMEAEKEQEADL